MNTRKLIAISISSLSALTGSILFIYWASKGIEGRVEGIGFTLGIMGLPSTGLVYILAPYIPFANHNGWTPAVLVYVVYMAQWQIIAYAIYSKHKRSE